MNTEALLENLYRRGITLEAEGGKLYVDAPIGTVTDELRRALADNKLQLVDLLKRPHGRARDRSQGADRCGLIIRWSREYGYIALREPVSGKWHEVKVSECPGWVVEAAKAHDRRRHAANNGRSK